ncbi:NADPH:quinone oxidoreductase family protein [Prosthecodimorpha staleyi]|uniref:NADPH:quinone oxidoreductase family protein n=1 Tax=Prosthecodimorpha staleyi TaxID=2840188 RepID=A0A947D3B4_9HYPH|nr:NADPH:quinone oxidoreductase family protein [Prosthecodimorpha staleyi]MBT9289509.1 NADPH:quinone oxidoreductase family protein [Prosthecodimorpha staleyi]
MKAVLCRAFGPPSSLTVEDIPEPVPGPGEALVRVRAAGLNFYDTLAIRDKYQYKPALPFSPGGELAGEVEAVGPDTDPTLIGERVVVYSKWNACREKTVVPAEDLITIPDAVGFEQAAAVVVTYGTTMHALRNRADMVEGETLAVLGASGGVGQAAIEIGRLMGARVIACSSSEKLDFCREMGAHEVIAYDQEDLKLRLRELTDGRGVDVVYDAVGDKYTEPAVRALAWRGRLLVVGFAAGEIPRIPLNLLLLKGCDLRGVFWGESILREPEDHADNMAQIMDWIAAGQLKPHIHATYPLDETAAALEAIASRKVKGKVLVVP